MNVILIYILKGIFPKPKKAVAEKLETKIDMIDRGSENQYFLLENRDI